MDEIAGVTPPCDWSRGDDRSADLKCSHGHAGGGVTRPFRIDRRFFGTFRGVFSVRSDFGPEARIYKITTSDGKKKKTVFPRTINY